MKYDITPVAKPRMTQRDRWAKRPCVLKYFAFKDECRAKEVRLNESGDRITFVIPMSDSWSNKKKAQLSGQPHQQKPDLDNLIKGLFDAVFDEDSQIWNFTASKVWGERGAIIIE